MLIVIINKLIYIILIKIKDIKYKCTYSNTSINDEKKTK